MTDDNGKPVLVKDEYGTYQRITLNPASASASKVTASVDPSVRAAGFTDAEVLAGQQFIAKFIAEEAVDSSALDTGSDGYEAWLKNTAPKYGSEYLLNGLQTPEDMAKPGIVANSVTGKDADGAQAVTFPYVRNGGPREMDLQLNVKEVKAETREGIPYLTFSGHYDTQYAVEPKTLIAAYEKLGFTLDQVKQQFPTISEESGTMSAYGTNDWFYGLQRSGKSWRIAGYNSNWGISLVQ